ncbi:MAG TPA: sugar phosphate isomerase/epimerase, partial [Haliscomenobacter sp.]|nr:sugar phosphate isomerase/epimerase [Haliscomenobacter sp.]
MKQIKPFSAKQRGIRRREFVQTASLGLAALSSPISILSSLVGGTAMGIVVHSYATRWNAKTESKNYPAFTNAIQLLEHSHSIGAGGIQVVVGGWTQ